MEDLENYLKLVTLPERAELFLKACKLLVESGAASILDELPNQLAMAEVEDTETTLKGLESFFLQCLIRKLEEFGVGVNECDMKTATAIVETLQLLDGFDMSDTIATICEGDSTPEEKLADLTEVVGLVDWGVVMTVVDRVSPKLIERIYELAGKVAEEQEENYDVTRNVDFIKVRLASFVTKFPNSLIVHALEERFPLGTSLKVSLKAFEHSLLTLQPKDAAREFVGIVLASDTPDGSVERAVAEAMESVYHDAEFLLTANSSIIELLKGVQYAEV